LYYPNDDIKKTTIKEGVDKKDDSTKE